MSWASCMENKITNYYGAQAGNCAQELSSGNLGEIAECILSIVTDASPASVAANLAGWSIGCAFSFIEDFKQVQSAAKPK